MSTMAKVSNSKVCFGTLALGDNYRALAQLLANDLETYSPTTPPRPIRNLAAE